MLRLWRACSGARPLLPLARGLATVPVNPALISTTEEDEQAKSHARIEKKYRRNFNRQVPAWAMERTSAFLMGRGFSKAEALRTMATSSAIVNFSPQMMEAKIDWLKTELGLSDEKVNIMIRRHPPVLGIAVARYMALIDWLMKLGVPKSSMAYVFTVFPSGASYSIEETLEPKVAFLKEWGFSDAQVARILVKTPQTLRSGVEGMATNLEYMTQLGIPRQQLLEVIANAPSCLSLRCERIQETIDALDEMLGPGAGVKALLTYPPIAMHNVAGLRKSFHYLVSTVGFTPERLSKNVQLIPRSVKDILRPRHEFLKKKGMDLTASTTWIKVPTSLFKTRYPGYEAYLAAYKARTNIPDVVSKAPSTRG